jgi:hypothetical protein
MIAMKFTIERDIGPSVLPQAALPQLVTDRETKTHRRGRSKRSYGHCRRRTEIPEAEPQSNRRRLHPHGLGCLDRCRSAGDPPLAQRPPL